MRREFDLHELAVEDAIKAHQRPKVEVYGDSLFVVLKTARWVDEPEFVHFGEILVFVGDEFVITVRHGETDLHEVRLADGGTARPPPLRAGRRAARDRRPRGRRLRARRRALDAAIREVEADVFSPTRSNPAERIYALKRAVLSLHGAIVPLVEPVAVARQRSLRH